MHIAIDITPLESAHSGRGIGIYTKNLISALQKYGSHHSYSFFTRKQKVPDKADIVHYPYFDPFFLTLPLVKTKPAVVTVHDLIPLVFPDKFPVGLRGNIKWQIQKQSLRGAKRIIADSQCSKNDVSKITGIDKSLIDVIYLAPDPTCMSTARKRISTPYFLYVGDVNWNKNIPGLLRAFEDVPHSELVLVGGAFTDTTLAETIVINSLISVLGIEHRIKRVGRVTSKKLTELYSGATALIQPSFYEGFGLPVLEAFACGSPVVASMSSSLREIAGPAIRVQPDNIESIADGMKYVLSLSSDARKNLIGEGDKWVTQFTWQKVARETVLAYEKALG
ncbi:MAG: glycosyltransferase family 1 protein [Candidatus Gottesmanbacteria bacterium]|nr:glycosyltransferase family 1 protein [Candidatus Gottesmanbacteria bacterium]